MAMMSMGEFKSISEATRKTLRIVTVFAKMPGFLVMTNPRLSAAEVQRVKATVLKFPKSEEGKKFFTLSGFSNIRDVAESELVPLDAFATQTRAGLGKSK